MKRANINANKLPEWKRQLLLSIRNERPHAKVVYLLPSKTGSTTVCNILNKYKGSVLLGSHSHTHKRKAEKGRINIMTIRHPVDRLKSFIDFIASKYHNWTKMSPAQRSHCIWDRQKHAAHKACACDNVNTIPKMIYGKKWPSGKSIKSSQSSYAEKGVICLKLDEIPEALQILLKLDRIPELPHVNKSEVKRPAFNSETISWLNKQEHFRADMRLWNKWTRAS